jgi:hypothetical protein
MVYYDCLNFELVNIKLREVTCLKKTFNVIFDFVFFFHWKHESILFLAILFLKLCAIWVHLSIGIVDKISLV